MVRLEDAEEYELPAIRRSDEELRLRTGSRPGSHPGSRPASAVPSSRMHSLDLSSPIGMRPADADDREHARLLSGEDGDGEGRKSTELDDDAGYRRSMELDADEVTGKGGKIEALIERSVPSTDDPALPTLTIRVILIGSFFCILGATASMMFYFKSNSPSFSTYFIILATYPLGKLLASERLVSRDRMFLGINLNPGPFNIKEAILVSVLASSGAMSAYAADILAILDLYYKAPLSLLPSITLLLTTQCIGFGLAGMLYNLLVARPSMYWPGTLVVVQLFTTLYGTSSSSLSSAGKLLLARRLQVFMLIFLTTLMYQFLPMLIFPTLTSVAVLCLINNNSWWMRTLGGAYSGLGMLDFSFDWSSVGSTGPLFTPYWALGNYFGGLIGMIWVVVPLMLVFNFWNARDFPGPTSPGLFNSSYAKFDVPAMLNPDLSLNVEAWNTSKPMLLTPYFAVTYGLAFSALSSILVHVWIWHRHEIKDALTNRAPMTDTHNMLMRAYRAVPQWWYLAMLAVNFAAAVLMVLTAPLQMPVWALVLSLSIAAVFLIPIGVVAAVSNTQIGLNVMTEFVAGYLMPGKPIGNVTFKCFGYMAMSQALQLVSDLKLGWYTSIPPREMFVVQTIGTVLGALTNYITLQSVLHSKRAYLDGTTVDPTGQWTGRRPQIFYSASIIWGAVSPARFFAGKYRLLYLGFPIGAAIPFCLWLAHRRWPDRKFNKVVFPIICSGAIVIPEYPTNIILTGAATAVLANSVVAKRWPRGHGQFVYVVSSALDAGTSIAALAIYVLFGGVLWTWTGPEWWGNSRIDSEHCKPGS